MSVPKSKKTSFRRKKLLWVSYLVLDSFLHKTSRIEILESLARRGYSVYLIAVESKRKYVRPKDSRIKIISIPIRNVPVISPIIFAGALLLVLPYYILRVGPDFIVTEPNVSTLAFLWSSLGSRLRRSKIFLDIRSTPVENVGFGGSLQNIYFNYCVLWARRFFEGITIITPMMKKEICDRFNIDQKLVGIWTSGVSLSLFDPGKFGKDALELRRRNGLIDKFIVLYHGRFSVQRGVVEIIKSVELLKNSCPNLRLFLLGSGPALSEMKEVSHRIGVEDRVIIHDAVDYESLPRYVAMCDIGVVPLPDLPDWRNQCPLKLLECLSMNKPVVVTKIPAHVEVLGDSDCAFYVSSSDHKAIAEMIAYAFDNRQRLDKLGSSGRSIVSKKYSWDKVAKDLDAYLNTAKGKLHKKVIS